MVGVAVAVAAVQQWEVQSNELGIAAPYATGQLELFQCILVDSAAGRCGPMISEWSVAGSFAIVLTGEQFLKWFVWTLELGTSEVHMTPSVCDLVTA